MQILVLNQSIAHHLIIHNFNLSSHPSIYTLIHEFDNAVMDFKTACECTIDTTVIVDKAITAVSRYKSILLKKKEFFRSVDTDYFYNQRHELSNKDKATIQIIMAGTTTLDTLIKESKLFDPNMKICASLHKIIYDFYKSEIECHLDSGFWYGLKMYEFLIHTNVIKNRYVTPFFSQEELETFFIENRKSILTDLLEHDRVYNPLDNRRLNNFFEIFKNITSISSTYQITRLIE
ncbi:hypothetical protein D3C80_330260 [compost metagenome]